MMSTAAAAGLGAAAGGEVWAGAEETEAKKSMFALGAGGGADDA